MGTVEQSTDESLGQTLKRLRGKRALRDVAKQAEIAFSYLNRLERGLATKPSPPVLERLAKALATDYISLLAKAGYL